MENLDNPHSCLALTVSFSFWLSVLNADSPEFILATWRNVGYRRDKQFLTWVLVWILLYLDCLSNCLSYQTSYLIEGFTWHILGTEYFFPSLYYKCCRCHKGCWTFLQCRSYLAVLSSPRLLHLNKSGRLRVIEGVAGIETYQKVCVRSVEASVIHFQPIAAIQRQPHVAKFSSFLKSEICIVV